MKVTFLAEQYRCGSDRGIYAQEKEGILDDLRLVVDLESSIYPEKWVETEDKKGYTKVRMSKEEFFGEGKDCILEPGHMFVYDGQIYAIDRPDRLILVLSETGALAVERFVNDILGEEVKLAKGDPEYQTSGVMISEVDKFPEDLAEEPYCIPYYTGKIWKEKTELPDMFQVIFNSSFSFLPIRLYVKGLNVFYYPEEVDEEMIPILTQEFMSWSWNNKK